VVLDEVDAETSVESILVRHGERRLSAEEFEEHFGDLPRDGEGRVPRMSTKGPVFPVAFDELATAEDLARLGVRGARARRIVGLLRSGPLAGTARHKGSDHTDQYARTHGSKSVWRPASRLLGTRAARGRPSSAHRAPSCSLYARARLPRSGNLAAAAGVARA
jgi:hypothetical protein